MKSCPKCNGDGCPQCGGSGMIGGTLPTCRICGKKDGSCEWDGEGYSHLRCRDEKKKQGHFNRSMG